MLVQNIKGHVSGAGFFPADAFVALKSDCLCPTQRLHGAFTFTRSFTRPNLPSQVVSAVRPLLPATLQAIEKENVIAGIYPNYELDFAGFS